MNEKNNDAISEKAASFGWIGKLSSDRKTQKMSQRPKSQFVQYYINNNNKIGLERISSNIRNLVSYNNKEFIFYLLVSDEENQKGSESDNLWWGAAPYSDLPKELKEIDKPENFYYVFISILSKPEEYKDRPFLHYVSLNTIIQNKSLEDKIHYRTTESKLNDEKTETIKLSLSKQEADDYNEIKYQLLFGKLDEAIQAICQRNNNNNNEKTGENNGTENQHII